MVEPKPCPVCGGTSFSVEFDDIGRGSVIARLICGGCEGEHPTYGPMSEPCGTVEEAEQAAIAAWNAGVPSRH